MSDEVTSTRVRDTPEHIPGYTFGTPAASTSPLTLDDLEYLKAAVGLTADDNDALREAAVILAPRAAEMVTAWRAHLAEYPHLAQYSAHPDGTPNPEYGAASKPRFERWIIDACTRPLDQAWLDYQEEIGLRHTPSRKNLTDNADSLAYIPMRYLLAFTAVVVTTSRTYLADGQADTERVERMHRAFTKSVFLHLTVWTRPYVDPATW